MKKLYTLFSILFLLPVFCYSQDFWEQINIPSGYTFSSVAVGDDGTIYLGSYRTNDTGWVFFSGNDGASWDTLRIAYHSINSLALNHEGNLLVGTSGDIYLYDLEQQSLNWVHSSVTNFGTLTRGPSNTFFAAGNSFNRSYYDGHTWEETVYMEQDAIYSIVAQSIDTIYIGTTNFFGGGGVFRSIDGGDIWQNIGMVNHFITSLGMNSTDDLFAGGDGEYYYGVGGIYKLSSGSDTWDTLSYWPRIRAIEVTDADIIYCGYWLTGENHGGVMHSTDNGETWIIDTAGMGDVGISKLVLGNNETLYALSSHFPPSKLFRSVLPVSVNHPFLHVKGYNSFCFPNPFSTTTTLQFNLNITDADAIEVRIFDQAGRKIKQMAIENAIAGLNSIEISMEGFPAGMYYYALFINGRQTDTKKMVVAR